VYGEAEDAAAGAKVVSNMVGPLTKYGPEVRLLDAGQKE
jgi:hypothetical protein